MNRPQLQRLHTELDEAIKPIVEKFGLEYLSGTLTHDGDGISMPIKATRAVTITTALTADTQTLRAGFARPGTKAIINDHRAGQHRTVIITDVKRKKYGFYFADDPEKRPMIGHFQLFSSTN